MPFKVNNIIDKTKQLFQPKGSNNKAKKKHKHSGKAMIVLNKLSRGFMLPIAILPIAGILLGVGTTIQGFYQSGEAGWLAGHVILNIGNVPFQNLAILFAISVAISFTENAGSAALTALFAFLVFNAFQLPFINADQTQYNYIFSLVNQDGTKVSVTLTSDSNAVGAVFNQIAHDWSQRGTTSINEWWIQEWNKPVIYGTGSQSISDFLNSNGVSLHDITNAFSNYKFAPGDSALPTEITKVVNSYDLWFWGKATSPVASSLFTPNLGILSLNAGVFAGILVGALVAWFYNRFHTTQLPNFIGFFNGTRFVPIVVIIPTIILSIIFILVWPGIGIGLNAFGELTGKIPNGGDSFIFEIFERGLVPFGLHHVFYAPLWWTSAGGSLADVNHAAVANPQTLLAQGDQSCFVAILGDGFLKMQDVWSGSKVVNGQTLTWTPLHVGRFMAGKYPFMMFGLPAAAAAMYLTVPKANRSAVLGIYASAALTTFLTGITEPIEYTFLFLAPWLFYCIHLPLCCVSFLLMNLLQVKVGMTFSGGALDLIIYGVLPFIAHNTNNFYYVFVVGAVAIPVYFTVFYFAIRWANVAIPGRNVEQGEDVHLFTKAEFKAKKAADKETSVSKKPATVAAKIKTLIDGQSFNLGAWSATMKTRAFAFSQAVNSHLS